MSRKRKPEKTEIEKLRLLSIAGVKHSLSFVDDNSDENGDLCTLEQRVQKVLDLANNTLKETGNMLFFVMYDIENNKVRNLIVKYLQRKGCWRVQKSIFLAEAPFATYETIKQDLTEVQAAYQNNDSIMVLPVSTDYLQMMKIIGKEIDVDIITRRKSTIFF